MNNNKIGIASDHRGYVLKQNLINNLKNEYEIIDLGTDSEVSCDYTDYAIKLCNKINDGLIKEGILICGNGIGMSMVANKIKNIRCARVVNVEDAKLCKEHNNANVISLASSLPLENAIDIIHEFVKSKFTNEERHIRRVNKISELE